MKYQRVVIAEHGRPELLQVVEDELVEPGPDEVRVRVLAAGVAWADVMMRTGLYPGKLPPTPFTPGYDIAGRVDRMGEGVAEFDAGQPVAAITKFCGYAEFINVPARNLVPVPEGLDPARVTCLPLNYLTAYQILTRFARVRPGERVLIHGAAGGVGSAFLQLGRLEGLELYGTASRQKHAFVREYGGVAIDYQNEDFVERVYELTGDGVDAVFDPIGGSHLRLSFGALRPGGRLIAYGERAIVGVGSHDAAEAQEHEKFLANWRSIASDRSVQWFEVYDNVISHPDWYREDMATLIDLLAQERVDPVIAERFRLDEAGQAHALLESSAVTGKIVLICDG